MLHIPAETTFAYIPAEEVTEAQWEELVDVNTAAVHKHYKHIKNFVTHPDVIRMTGFDGPKPYAERLVQLADSSRLLSGQRYSKPHVTLALDERSGSIVSWVLSANNTSGPDAVEKMEALVPTRRWQWLGWMATHPDHADRGLATIAVAVTIAKGSTIQPVSAYALPGDKAHKPLVSNGLYPVGESPSFPESHEDDVQKRRYVSARNPDELYRFMPRKLATQAFVRSLPVRT